jgi:hypothetical protein
MQKASSFLAAARTGVQQRERAHSELPREDGNLREARIIQGFASEMTVLVDISRTDAYQLLFQMVAVKTASGIEVRWLMPDKGVYTLYPFEPGLEKVALRMEGEWSIAGQVVRLTWASSTCPQRDPALEVASQFYGIYSRIAVNLGVTISQVRDVVKGSSKSKRISKALGRELVRIYSEAKTTPFSIV